MGSFGPCLFLGSGGLWCCVVVCVGVRSLPGPAAGLLAARVLPGSFPGPCVSALVLFGVSRHFSVLLGSLAGAILAEVLSEARSAMIFALSSCSCLCHIPVTLGLP